MNSRSWRRSAREPGRPPPHRACTRHSWRPCSSSVSPRSSMPCPRSTGQPAPYYWIALAALALASQFWKIKVPGDQGAPVRLRDRAVHDRPHVRDRARHRHHRRGRPAGSPSRGSAVKIRRKLYQQAAFGLGEPVLSMWVASHVFSLLSGVRPAVRDRASLQSVALPTLAMGAAYFAMNSGLNAVVLSTSAGTVTPRTLAGEVQEPRRDLRQQRVHLARARHQPGVRRPDSGPSWCSWSSRRSSWHCTSSTGRRWSARKPPRSTSPKSTR